MGLFSGGNSSSSSSSLEQGSQTHAGNPSNVSLHAGDNLAADVTIVTKSVAPAVVNAALKSGTEASKNALAYALEQAALSNAIVADTVDMSYQFAGGAVDRVLDQSQYLLEESADLADKVLFFSAGAISANYDQTNKQVAAIDRVSAQAVNAARLSADAAFAQAQDVQHFAAGALQYVNDTQNAALAAVEESARSNQSALVGAFNDSLAYISAADQTETEAGIEAATGLVQKAMIGVGLLAAALFYMKVVA